VTIPFNVTKPDAGFLFIEGGHNDPDMNPPTPTDNIVQLTSVFAVSTGAIGASLKQIPNQPIVFKVNLFKA
jgi:PhoPQ-activated pathogenicity-related protein